MTNENLMKEIGEKVFSMVKETEPKLPNCRCGGSPKLVYTGHDGWSIRCMSCYIKAMNDMNIHNDDWRKRMDSQLNNVVKKWNRVMK